MMLLLPENYQHTLQIFLKYSDNTNMRLPQIPYINKTSQIASTRMRRKAFSWGFSMVEMIIYVALLSFFMIVAINGAIIMISSYSKAQSARLLDSSINLLVSKIGREARGATSINDALSIFNQSPGRISFFTTNAGVSVPLEFYIEGGVLKMKRDGVFIGDVTLPGVSVDEILFKKIDNFGRQAFKMTITLTANKSGQTKTENFYYTTALRGGY